MTEKRYEAYYDKYMEDWKVQDILTLDILPCVSEKVAKEFENKLNNSYCGNKKLLKSNDFLLKEIEQLKKENKKLKASLYAEKTNTAEVVNDYAKQFKRHSAQFSFMMDLAEDLGVDIKKLEALDD